MNLPIVAGSHLSRRRFLAGAGVVFISPGILADGTLYVAGQTGSDLKTGAIPAKFEDEVKLCLDNIGLVLKEAGMTFQDAVAVQVYLTDMELFQRMNTVYTTYFKEPRPARTTEDLPEPDGPITARKREFLS